MVAGYTEDDLQAALEDVECKIFSIRKVAQIYNIPFGTLQRRCQSGDWTIKRHGLSTILSSDEEAVHVKWIECCQRIGHCRMEDQLLDTV